MGEKKTTPKKTRSKSDLLSPEMKVAAEIYSFNAKNQKVWFTKLADSLRGEVSISTIHKAINALTDWGIVRVQYGETDRGKAGRLLVIPNESKDTIALVYGKYWKDREK